MNKNTAITQDMNNQSCGCINIHRPETEANPHQTVQNIVNIAKNVPAAFACSDCCQLPRTINAQDVVIPQLGHGTPYISLNRHGENPSC
jgi:hypothetical protein